MIIEKLSFGGVFLYESAPFELSEKARASILEKWDSANYDGEVDELIEEAKKIASPKAFLRIAYVAVHDESGAVLTITDDETKETRSFRFDSPLIAEKLTQDTTVAGTLLTCGPELHKLAMSQEDPLLRGVADELCLAYMRQIDISLHEYAHKAVFGGDKFSTLSPGSLTSWDITHQSDLFALLGEGAPKCGVELTPSFLMIPYKSGSGLYFPTDSPFESCMRCPRLNCPGRRAAYAED